MKVMCVENSKYEMLKCAPPEMVIVGEIYTVIERVNWYGSDWYVLEEMKSGWGWNVECFIPLLEDKKEETAFDKLLSGMLIIPKYKKSKV